MAYSEFTYLEAKRRFGLSVTDDVDLFADVAPVEPSDWLRETLESTLSLAIAVATEKARSEWIIAPNLMVVEAKNENMRAGLGQCLAAMVGAQRFNEREGTPREKLYGAVTTGTNWRFREPGHESTAKNTTSKTSTESSESSFKSPER